MEVLKKGTDLCANVGFCYDMVLSVRELLFKEDPKTIPKAKLIFNVYVFIILILFFNFIFFPYFLRLIFAFQQSMVVKILTIFYPLQTILEGCGLFDQLFHTT